MANKMLWIKIWHWTNGILCLILIITGLHMQYAGSQYTFIPFKASIGLHNLCAILMVLCYMGFVIWNIKSQNVRNYKFDKIELKKGTRMQARFYAYGIFKAEKDPFPTDSNREFNPLQKLSYVIIMYFCFPLLIITGLGMMFPEIIADHVFGISGFLFTDLLHVIIAFIVSLFLIVHVYFSYFHGLNKKHDLK